MPKEDNNCFFPLYFLDKIIKGLVLNIITKKRYSLGTRNERVTAGEWFALEKSIPKRKHFIPKRLPSSCQISTYCTWRDKRQKTTAKHYKENLFHQSESSCFFSSLLTLLLRLLRKINASVVYKSVAEWKVMHIQKDWRQCFSQIDTMSDNNGQFLLHAYIKQFIAWVNS